VVGGGKLRFKEEKDPFVLEQSLVRNSGSLRNVIYFCFGSQFAQETFTCFGRYSLIKHLEFKRGRRELRCSIPEV
jgi:hypothetical protein